jgi:hypothetical protein
MVFESEGLHKRCPQKQTNDTATTLQGPHMPSAAYSKPMCFRLGEQSHGNVLSRVFQLPQNAHRLMRSPHQSLPLSIYLRTTSLLASCTFAI